MKRLLIAAFIALTACPPPTQAPLPAPTTAPRPTSLATASSAAPKTDEVAERAAHFIALAKTNEPDVTALLNSVAKELGAEMYKLEFRIKTQASAERKIRMIVAKHNVKVSEVWLDDALRYTIKLDDEPPGAYVAGVQKVLTRLETASHRVKKLKNYWPSEDNYSGINGVLIAGDGLEWELQFHTSASIEAQSRTRPLYEEMRLVATPLERKRELFDQMTDVWRKVPTPRGALESSLHPKSQTIDRPRP